MIKYIVRLLISNHNTYFKEFSPIKIENNSKTHKFYSVNNKTKIFKEASCRKKGKPAEHFAEIPNR